MLRFFSNVVSSVNISQYEDLIVDINQFEDAAIRDNEKYKNHPSIREIAKITSLLFRV